MTKYKINLVTLNDVKDFVNIVQRCAQGQVFISDGTGLKVNARSIMGVIYSLEWNTLYLEAEHDFYTEIKQYVV